MPTKLILNIPKCYIDYTVIVNILYIGMLSHNHLSPNCVALNYCNFVVFVPF